MITTQVQVRKEEEEPRKRLLYVKTLEVPIGGSTFYFDIPNSPLAYVSETNGVLYINGSAYWDSELYMLKDLKGEFIEQVEELAKATGKRVVKMRMFS